MKQKERNKFIFPNTFKVDCLIDSPRSFDISDLIKVIGNKILGYNVAHIIVQYQDSLLDKFSTKECPLEALLDKTDITHTYNLFLRKNSTVALSTLLCHEMQHFDQYERKDLDIVKNEDRNNLQFVWKGIVQDSKQPYESRPWEQEAKIAEYDLWKQFRKLYYKK